MKKITNIFYLSLCLLNFVYGQERSAQMDLEVYRDLLSQIAEIEKSHPAIMISTDKMPLYYKTVSRLLKVENLKDKPLPRWEIYNNSDKDWKQFVDNAILNKVREQKLIDNIGTHPLTRQQYSEGQARTNGFETLSPVVYSKDKALAMGAVETWYGSDNASETLYVLEFKNDKWVLIRSIELFYT